MFVVGWRRRWRRWRGKVATTSSVMSGPWELPPSSLLSFSHRCLTYIRCGEYRFQVTFRAVLFSVHRWMFWQRNYNCMWKLICCQYLNLTFHKVYGIKILHPVHCRVLLFAAKCAEKNLLHGLCHVSNFFLHCITLWRMVIKLWCRKLFCGKFFWIDTSVYTLVWP